MMKMDNGTLVAIGKGKMSTLDIASMSVVSYLKKAREVLQNATTDANVNR
jgi:hypothetical protein